MDQNNLKDFQENVHTYIAEYDVIMFWEDVTTLEFETTVFIEKDIEMKTATGMKIKIECPKSKEKLFDIM